MSNGSHPITDNTPPKQRYGCWTIGGFIILIALNLGVLFWWVFGPDRSIQSWKIANQVASLAFSPDNQLLAVPENTSSTLSKGEPYSVTLYNVRDGTIAQQLAGVGSNSVAFRADGGVLAAGGNDGIVRIWSMPEGQLIAELERHTSAVSSIAFSPDGQFLLSIEEKGDVHLWDIPTRTVIRTYNIPSPSGVRRVAFSPDGRFVVAASNGVWLWNAQNGRLQHQVPAAVVAFSADGQFMLAGEQLRRVDDDSIVQDYSQSQQYGQPFDLVISPDGQLFSTAVVPIRSGFFYGSQQTPIYLRRISDGTRVQSLRGHRNGVSSLAFSSDGRVLASAGGDGMVRIWRVGIFWPQRLIIFGLVVALQLFIVRRMAS
jgi:WD40 repeat protein